ncbi:MAG TPA: ABC transporter permease [Gemmatimonadaceae bacterium]|nr:ABC transporter permease [Gemmatimonadaceae bacterium]
MLQNIRLAARSLLRTPGLTAAAVTCLAIGVAANTTVFTAANAVALHPVPTPHGRGLVMLAETPPRGAEPDFDEIAPANLLDWERQSATLEQIAAFGKWNVNLTGILEPEAVSGFTVTPGFFRTLQRRPALGRAFTDEEGREGHTSSVILSDGLWRRHFGADSAVIGRAIQVNGVPHVVVGVMAPDFDFPAGAELWVPLALDGATGRERDARLVKAIGRLKPGVSIDRARSEATTIARQLELAYPEFNTKWGMRVEPADQFYGRGPRALLQALLGAVAFVLLIGCANVANLLLARATARGRELAVRVALGARRGDLIGQLLAESGIIAAVGGAVGVLVSFAGVAAIRAMVPAELARVYPGWARIAIDANALGFTLAVAIATVILTGVAPALMASRADPQEALREGGRGLTSGADRGRLRGALVIGEIALACSLLIGAGLMVRSLQGLLKAELGYRPEHVLTMRVTMPSSRYKTQSLVTRGFEQILASVRQVPGVRSAATTNYLLGSFVDDRSRFYLEGEPKPKLGETLAGVAYRFVSDGFLDAAGLTLIRGRDFTTADNASTPEVAIVTSRMARRFWPGKDAIGQRFTLLGDTALTTVIGIVQDVRQNPNVTSDPTEPMFFMSTVQLGSWWTMSLVIRTNGDPTSVAHNVERAIASVDGTLAPGAVQTLERVVESSMAPQRITAQLLTIFAALAILLAAIGVYGVMSYTVSRRTREIGVRIALGATSPVVVGQVMREAMILTGTGIGVGLIVAVGISRGIRALLYDTSPTDPLTFGVVTVVLLTIALAGSYVPARRAASVDPLVALRADG